MPARLFGERLISCRSAPPSNIRALITYRVNFLWELLQCFHK